MTAQFLQFNQHGTPVDVLSLVDQDLARPQSGQVLVRMLAAAINPSDLLHVAGNYGQEVSLPARVGFEGAGIVEASGGGLIAKLNLGKRVAVLARHGGTWGTHCVVDAKSVIPVPKSLFDPQAASFFVNPATAYLLTRKVLQIPRGEWLMQSAGASAVGRMVIVLGKKYGYRTLSLVRKEEQIAELKRLGGDVVLCSQGDDDKQRFRDRVFQECKSFPQFAIDPVGGEMGSALVSALGQQGRFISYGTLSRESIHFDPRQLMLNNATITSFWLGPYMQQLSLINKLGLVRQLTSLHRQRVFELPEVQSFLLRDYKDALDHVRNSPGGHKVVLKMNQDLHS